MSPSLHQPQVRDYNLYAARQKCVYDNTTCNHFFGTNERVCPTIQCTKRIAREITNIVQRK
ncbi:MAG: hypothetical protein PHH16_04345 [Candidatus Gracilibacteria bacterium]|nr:hypothetical protein [Candidatus Gracilibacteria bacterium]